MTYAEWIESQQLPQLPCGMCEHVSREMAVAFPELRLARGHYIPWAETKHYPHWWCVTPDGVVVDPTAGQFVGVGPGDYVEHVGDEPTGRCYECGVYVFTGEPFCDATCRRAWDESVAAISAPLPAPPQEDRP